MVLSLYPALERPLAQPERVWNSSVMGMYDTVLFVDELRELSCAHGHALRSFQTKDIDEPSMGTYLVRGGRLYRADLYRADAADRCHDAESELASWRFDGDGAVRERYTLSEVRGPLAINVYGSCRACEPVLVRTAEPGLFGDIVNEHALFVDFRLTFRPDEPIHIERMSGTRDDLKRELRSGGVYVLEDDEPLAVAHRELETARRRVGERAPRRGRRF